MRSRPPVPPSGQRRARSIGTAALAVTGELFLTAGLLVLLFLGWQLWLNDIIVGEEQRRAALEFSDTLVPDSAPHGEEPPADAEPQGEPVSTISPVMNEGFATLSVPRFGADYVRVIGEGVGLPEVLNRSELGVGHYPETQLPGELGNFALAAHRTTWGAPFKDIAELRPGDRLYVRTADAWYIYVFRNLEYVLPTGVGVLAPVPQAPGVAPGDRYITLTSCNPRYSAAERIVAYGVLESWHPIAEGTPAELDELREGES